MTKTRCSIEDRSLTLFNCLWISFIAVLCVCSFVFGVTRTWVGSPPPAARVSVERTTAHRGRGGIGVGRNSTPPFRYHPSEGEAYVLRDSSRLGFDERNRTAVPPSCAIWNLPNASTIYSDLRAYDNEIENYRDLIRRYQPLKVDVRQLLLDDGKDDACARLDLAEGGLESIFKTSQMLSSGSSFGYVEPILPPLRNPSFCWGGGLMDWRYLVHDYSAFCRRITPSSKLVFVDLGASLSFHGAAQIPILELIDEYYKFGFRFDHIYGFEITPTDPARVVEALPMHVFASYHWINVGVSDDPSAKTNPWNMIAQNFREEDFVVVKLDIDTPALEESLVRQLLTNRTISKLVDVFYFEHHVLLNELIPYWKRETNTSLKESMNMFVQLQELGIASHSWV